MTATYVAANKGQQLLIAVGDGADPEVFSSIASVNLSRSISLKANAVATEIPRTDDVTAPAQTVRDVTAVDWSAQGAGICDTAGDKVLADWLISGATKNVKLSNAKTGGLVLSGPAKLTQYDMSGDRGGKVQNTLTLEGDGIPTTSAAS